MSKEFRSGRTIVGARGRSAKVELERLAGRRRRWRRTVLVWGICLMVLIGLVISVTMSVKEMITETRGAATDEPNWTPTVEIVAEGGGSASERVREFVAKVERDFRDYEYEVDRVVLPLGMTREVDVYVVDRVEYYKMSIDRGSAVAVEDAERMMRYLDERELTVLYVDLRVEGRAYYR